MARPQIFTHTPARSHGWNVTAWKASNSLHIEPYGAGNLLPQQIMATVYDSGTATACFRRLSRFIKADGFREEASGKAVVGFHGETADALLSQLVPYVAMFTAPVLAVRFSLGGEFQGVEVLANETVRRLKKTEANGNYAFVSNEKLGTRDYQGKDDVFYHAFAPGMDAGLIRRQIKEQLREHGYYNGHLLYLYDRLPGQNVYPVPLYWSAKEDMETDAALGRVERKEVKSGFRPDAWVTVIGPEYSDVTNDKGELVDSPKMEQMMGVIKDLKGSDTDSSVLITAAAKKDEVPQIHSFESKALSRMSDQTDRIARKVCKAWGVPPFLVGVETPGKLGASSEIFNLIALFQMDVVEAQGMLQRLFESLFPGPDWSISTLNPVQFIPDQIWATLTPEEIAALKKRYL